MTTVTIKGSLDYIRASGQLEFPPSYVMVYLDTFFSGEPLRLVSADQNPGFTNFEVTGTLPEGVAQVPRDARLVFQTYISTVNDYGAICLEDTGMTSVEIYNAFHMANANTKAVFRNPLVMQSMESSDYSAALVGQSVVNNNFKNELRIQTNQDVKGSLHIVVDSITSSRGDLAFNLTQNHNALDNFREVIDMVQAYNYNAGENLKKFTINVKNTENITCFWYPSNCTFGGGTTQLMMPMPAYLMSKVPPSSPEWWMQQLEIMADRQNFASAEAFCKAWPTMTLKEKSVYTNLLITQYVHTLEYVSDRSNGQMIEMFGEAIAMRSGDCEDFAKAIIKMYQSFGLYGNKSEFSVLKEIYDISKQYVYMFCLEGVTATHTQNDTDFKSEIDGAHAACKALPRDYFGECIARGDPSHILGQITCAPAYRGKLDVIVLEGTGMLWPVGRLDGHEKLRRMIGEGVEAIRPIKKYLYNTPTDSKFYKQIMLGATLEFIKDYKCATFYFSTPVEGSVAVPNTGATMGKGVPFTLLVQRSPLVYLTPLNCNAPVKVNARNASLLGLDVNRCTYSPEFTQKNLDIMESVVRACVPPPNFTAVTTGPVIDRDMSRIQNPFMDTLCEGLKTMKQTTMANCQKQMATIAANNNPEDFKWKVQYFINPQYLTQSFVNNFIMQMRRLNVALDASYLLERHLDDYTTYRLTIEMLDTCAMGIAPTTLPNVIHIDPTPAPSTKTAIGAPFFWH